MFICNLTVEAGAPVGAGKIWTVEGVSSSGDGDNTSLEDEDSKLLLLEKEFEDFYEDQVAEAVIFYLKAFGYQIVPSGGKSL